LGPEDCQSDTLSKTKSHQLLISTLDCLDFTPKKHVPSYINKVLTDEAVLAKLIDIVISPAFDSFHVRNRVADLLSLGKMSRVVDKVQTDSDLRASVIDLSKAVLDIGEYPIQEQVVYFLHVLYRRLANTKAGNHIAIEILRALKGTCPPLHDAFPNFSNSKVPFYDMVRSCLEKHQNDKIHAWTNSGTYTKWFGEVSFV